MQNLKLLPFLLTLLLIIISCAERKDVVGKVGKEPITTEEFKTAFLERFRSEENALKRTLDDRKQFLREMAVSEAKYQEGLARGYDKLPEITEQLNNIASRQALDMLYQEKIIDAVVTDAAARDFYEKSAKEIRASHILIKKNPADTTDEAKDRLRARADSVKGLIQNGLSFKAAAVQFSEDATTAPDSGDLEWFGWGRMVEEFQRAVWNAKLHELVGPVESPFGYHLIVVDSVRQVEGRKSYEESEEQIKSRLREVEGQKMADVAREYVENLRKSYNLAYDEQVLADFSSRVQDPTVTQKGPLDPVFTEEQKKKVAATYKGGTVTIADMIAKVGENAYRIDWKDPQTTKDLVNAIAEPKLLEDAARKEGLFDKAQQAPDVVAQKRSAIIRQVEKTDITDKIQPTEEDEKNYYNTHLDNFIQPEMREIREIFIKEDSAKAARVHERAASGENFTQLALRFNEKESTKNDTGRVGPFEEKRFGLIGKTAFSLQKEGDISGPVKIGSNWSVVKLLKIVPSRTKTWEESMAQARREYRLERTNALQKELEETLLAKHKFTVNEENLAAVWPLPEGQGKIAREP